MGILRVFWLLQWIEIRFGSFVVVRIINRIIVKSGRSCEDFDVQELLTWLNTFIIIIIIIIDNENTACTGRSKYAFHSKLPFPRMGLLPARMKEQHLASFHVEVGTSPIFVGFPFTSAALPDTPL